MASVSNPLHVHKMTHQNQEMKSQTDFKTATNKPAS